MIIKVFLSIVIFLPVFVVVIIDYLDKTNYER